MNDLWTRWAQHYDDRGIASKRICRDGIVDSDRFAQAPERVLFVLREVNDWEGGNICEFLASGPRYQTWHTVARWAAGLLRAFPPFDEVDRYDVMRDSLRSVAAINLKKASGGSSADLSVVSAYAWQDRELLREQIDDIAPNTIVACGTADVLVWLLDLSVNPERPREPIRGSHAPIWVLPWVHPTRCDNRRSYADLGKLAAGRQAMLTTM